MAAHGFSANALETLNTARRWRARYRPGDLFTPPLANGGHLYASHALFSVENDDESGMLHDH
jgi:hypothetical protein